MPIYEYRCTKCGKTHQYLHRRMNEAAPPCPDCGGELKRLFSSFSAKTASNGCPHQDSCPSAPEHHHCGCNCGCHHHH